VPRQDRRLRGLVSTWIRISEASLLRTSRVVAAVRETQVVFGLHEERTAPVNNTYCMQTFHKWLHHVHPVDFFARAIPQEDGVIGDCWRRPDFGPLWRPGQRLAGSGRWRSGVRSTCRSPKIFCRFLDRIAASDMIMKVAPRPHARKQLRLPAGNWNDVWRPA
jgi:hypothetical protein